MKMLLIGILTVISLAASASSLDFSAIESQAYADFDNFESANPVLSQNTFVAINDFKQELASNRDLKKMIKKGRRSLGSRELLKESLIRHFDDRGIKLGLVRVGRFTSINIILGGFTVRGEGGDYGHTQMEIGPGLGWATGYDMVACALEGTGFNVGVVARAIVIAGIEVGTYVGRNGICLVVGASYGLNVSAGLGILNIE